MTKANRSARRPTSAARPIDNLSIANASDGDASDAGAFEAQFNNANGFVVTKTADTGDGACGADCSLREAIASANANPGADWITFDVAGAGPHLIQLTGALSDLAQSVKILNASGEPVAVRRDTGSDYRIFTVGAEQIVQISNLTIINGNTAQEGGGIRNAGTLTLSGSAVSGSTSSGFGGGGIYNDVGATVNITNSAVSGNTAAGNGNGGGIAGVGTISVTNSTVSGNSAVFGGGIITFSGTALSLASSTVVNNSSQNFGGGILEQNGGATLRNCIVANNTAATDRPDISGVFNSEGYNLIEITTGATVNETQNPGTNITGQDPNLGPLQNNGGATQTHALLTGSPAIDKGRSFGLTVDQRGFARPIDVASIANQTGGDGADIGAFETLDPTAAAVSLSGRVLTAAGRGLANARVTLTDAAGRSRSANTGALGFYQFADVTAGETYVVAVHSKRYQFAPRVLTVTEDLTDLSFSAVR